MAEQANTPGTEGRDISRLRFFLSGLLLLQLIGAFLPGPLLWGINHLAYAPLIVRILPPLFGFLVVWSPWGERLGAWLAGRIAPLLDRRLIVYLVLPLLGGSVFWLLRTASHFLGDGWLIGELMEEGMRFHGYDFLDYHLHARAFMLLRPHLQITSFEVFAVASVIAGAAYLAAAAYVVRGLATDAASRLLLYALLVLLPPLQIFMGYVECYAHLMVCTLLYLGLLARHLRGEVPLWAPATAFACGLFFHMDAVFLAPLLAVPVFWPAPGRASSFFGRLLAVALPVLTAIALGIAIYLLGGYNRQWYEFDFLTGRRFERVFVELTGHHGLLSLTHWKDVINLLLLLAPVPLALLLAAGPRLRAQWRTSRARTPLVAGCIWLILLTVILHMKLGVARDWDLFAAQAPIFAVTAFLAWAPLAAGKSGARLIGPVAAVALVLCLPWFWLNAGDERSVQRFSDVIGDLPGHARAYAHEEIAKYHRDRGDFQAALEEYTTATRIFPGNARFHTALAALHYNHGGNRDSAFVAFRRALEVDSTFAIALQMVARIHFERAELEEALPYARRLAGQRSETAKAAVLHGLVAEQLRLYEEADAAFRRATARDPAMRGVFERVARLAMQRGEPGRAEIAYRELLRLSPRSVPARQGIIVAVHTQYAAAPEAWVDEPHRRRMAEAVRLLESLVAEGRANAELIDRSGALRRGLGGGD